MGLSGGLIGSISNANSLNMRVPPYSYSSVRVTLIGGFPYIGLCSSENCSHGVTVRTKYEAHLWLLSRDETRGDGKIYVGPQVSSLIPIPCP